MADANEAAGWARNDPNIYSDAPAPVVQVAVVPTQVVQPMYIQPQPTGQYMQPGAQGYGYPQQYPQQYPQTQPYPQQYPQTYPQTQPYAQPVVYGSAPINAVSPPPPNTLQHV